MRLKGKLDQSLASPLTIGGNLGVNLSLCQPWQINMLCISSISSSWRLLFNPYTFFSEPWVHQILTSKHHVQASCPEVTASQPCCWWNIKCTCNALIMCCKWHRSIYNLWFEFGLTCYRFTQIARQSRSRIENTHAQLFNMQHCRRSDYWRCTDGGLCLIYLVIVSLPLQVMWSIWGNKISN